jgi:hypothetical protein
MDTEKKFYLYAINDLYINIKKILLTNINYCFQYIYGPHDTIKDIFHVSLLFLFCFTLFIIFILHWYIFISHITDYLKDNPGIIYMSLYLVLSSLKLFSCILYFSYHNHDTKILYDRKLQKLKYIGYYDSEHNIRFISYEQFAIFIALPLDFYITYHYSHKYIKIDYIITMLHYLIILVSLFIGRFIHNSLSITIYRCELYYDKYIDYRKNVFAKMDYETV